MANPNVLRVNSVEEQTAYRKAVSEIIRRVLNERTDRTLQDIAEEIDVSLGTVSNAFNRKADLNPIYLKRLGERYGAHMLDPFMELVGGRAVSREVGGIADILPLILQCGHKVASARAPDSPAGVVETLSEKLGYVADLRHLRRDLDLLIAGIERDAA